MQKINFNRMSTDIAQLIRQKTIFIEPITIIIGNPKYAGYSCYNNPFFMISCKPSTMLAQ